MSSQDLAGIPLSHSPDGTGYKLLELPPELLELLESQDCPTLTLHPSPTAALLKTPNKTYSLRQKNTSNALILLSPTSSSDISSDNVEQETATTATAGLATIATAHETIELVPEAEEAAVAAPKPRGKWHEKFARVR
ncbi:hypothetical protein N658DRAFT_455325 [Parathielavia hyrcaniae]|uniref:Uncharacterized protein n=1 Tax=Parathielavia hyrcaniae TaxID=113614 RepID=A0AAN6PZK0_9PEZI|nr:hypothetical protein N658DRAFT_455325 [Parathielavia hyrcaniae]